METQIKKLIELAKEYRAFGKKMYLPNTHTEIRSESRGSIAAEWWEEGRLIQVYFASDRSVCSVYFDKVDVSLYSGKISFHFDITSEYLEELCKDVTDYLTYIKAKVSHLAEEAKAKENEKEIKVLKERLAKLTGSKEEIEEAEKLSESIHHHATQDGITGNPGEEKMLEQLSENKLNKNK